MKRYGGAGQDNYHESKTHISRSLGGGGEGRVLKPTSYEWQEGPYIGPYA
jgi:hypothetical protein